MLVVIYTPALEVLLIRRSDSAPDAPEFWQSVTGSKDSMDEAFCDTAAREVLEETGIDCRPGSVLAHRLIDWQLENVYDIYPRWHHRYAPGVSRNIEHLFGLQALRSRSARENTRPSNGCHGNGPRSNAIRHRMPRRS